MIKHYIRQATASVLDFVLDVPPFVKNKYVLSTLLFVIWMLFFDTHNLIRGYYLKKTLHQAVSKQYDLDDEIERLDYRRNQLLTDPAALEKFAREEYLMKKDDEEIIVIVR